MPHHSCAQSVTSDFFLSQAFTPLPAAWAKSPGHVCHHKPGRQTTHFRQHLPEHNKRPPSPVPKTASEQKANTVLSENGYVCWVIVSWACCTQSSIHISILMWGLARLCLIANFCPAQPVPMLHSYPPFSQSANIFISSSVTFEWRNATRKPPWVFWNILLYIWWV